MNRPYKDYTQPVDYVISDFDEEPEETWLDENAWWLGPVAGIGLAATLAVAMHLVSIS